MLAFVFDAASVGDPAAESEGQSPGSGGVFSGLFGGQRGTTKAAASGSKSSSDKAAAEIEAAAETWQEAATGLFIFGAMLLLGKELQPSSAEAEAITRPLVRILMRHYDPLRQGSNDMVDLVTCLVAASLYGQRIWPVLQARQREKKVQAFRGNTRPQIVPIDRGASSGARAGSGAGAAATIASNGSQPGLAATDAAAHRAGQPADALRRDPGAALRAAEAARQGPDGHVAVDAGLIEEFIGGPL